jgi:hypothetical protein
MTTETGDMISLTSVPGEVFVMPCVRHDNRFLCFRGDDPDGREAVVFVGETVNDVSEAVVRMVDTAVVVDRDGLVALAQAFLAAALDMNPGGGSGGALHPSRNGGG